MKKENFYVDSLSDEFLDLDVQGVVFRVFTSKRNIDSLHEKNSTITLFVYELIKEDLGSNNLNPKDINLLIPHQASNLAIKAYSKYGGFDSNKVINIIESTGNCVAASLPLALAIANKNNRIKRGDLVYMVGTGAGLSIASALVKF